METRRKLGDLRNLNSLLKCACLVAVSMSIVSCNENKPVSLPTEISTNYCAENKLLVERLSSNAISKEVAIEGGGAGLAGCAALVFLTAGMDLGALAGICTLVVAGTTWGKVLTMDEAATVQKVLDVHLDPRCATLQK